MPTKPVERCSGPGGDETRRLSLPSFLFFFISAFSFPSPLVFSISIFFSLSFFNSADQSLPALFLVHRHAHLFLAGIFPSLV